MQDKWALEEHLSTAENNQLWHDAGEAARNGKVYMDYVESHLLDVDERLRIRSWAFPSTCIRASRCPPSR